ncbi:alpha/beta-hydrolase [Piedraia hortae CBS 480.64]|uniref:Alpha/beta-hydrolase n=1 Tax=Piedraia hortae CBS 480.64 TaxID=1314780 RepID=A0A6A7BTU6_9PEZI|nr:alpha/beta-hydrolase [Piedraia hortae CBS 480.64]
MRPWQAKRFLSSLAQETIKVPVGNCNITLDIHHPLKSSPNSSHSPTVLVHFARGPVAADTSHDLAFVSALRTHLPFTVVQLNYCLGEDHPYPGPVHDAVIGYEWVVEHVLHRKPTGRVGVSGELVGGSLAAMLSLTECRIGEPGIVATALNLPIVDWTVFERTDVASPSDSGPGGEQPVQGDGWESKLALIQWRPKLFRKDEHFFDPFASPILFFRSAGRLPSGQDLGKDSEISTADKPGESDSIPTTLEELEAVALEMTPRKASKRFPSVAFRLRLPQFYISSGRDNLLDAQIHEFTRQLKQSHIRQVTPSRFGRKVLTDEEVDRAQRSKRREDAEKKALLSAQEKSTLWDDTPAGQERIMEAIRWLGGRLL